MHKHTFKVKKSKSDDAVEFTVNMPADLSDTGLITARFGTVERMIDRANSQWTVDVAVGIRKRLPNTEKAEAYAESYCDNGSKDTYVPTINAEEAKSEQGFTDEQLKYIAERGMNVA